MGEGGYITMLNATDRKWIKQAQHSYQMHSWNFPQEIMPGTTKRIYVEWDDTIFHNRDDDGGEVRYQLEGTCGASFELDAIGRGHRRIVARADKKLPRLFGCEMEEAELGWIHNGSVNFTIAGDKNGFCVTGDNCSDFIQRTLTLYPQVTLQALCILGAHDAGMSVCQNGTGGATSKNTVTQTYSIAGQLQWGARYFDLRPTISGGTFYTGHYSSSAGKVQFGANGQKMSDIITQINSFTREHRELVILNLSHDLNTDVGFADYREFSSNEWQSLLQALTAINHLRCIDRPGDLSSWKVRDLLAGGPAVLIIVEPAGKIPVALENKGFFPKSCLSPYNSYSNTDNLSQMAADQIMKMHANKDTYFLLSWTLTQNAASAVLSYGSIIELAEQANGAVADQLYDAVGSGGRPNILYIDKVGFQTNGAIVHAINRKLLQ